MNTKTMSLTELLIAREENARALEKIKSPEYIQEQVNKIDWTRVNKAVEKIKEQVNQIDWTMFE